MGCDEVSCVTESVRGRLAGDGLSSLFIWEVADGGLERSSCEKSAPEPCVNDVGSKREIWLYLNVHRSRFPRRPLSGDASNSRLVEVFQNFGGVEIDYIRQFDKVQATQTRRVALEPMQKGQMLKG